MPEIIPNHAPSPRTLLAWDGTAYRPVSIDAAGRLQVRGEDQLHSYNAPLCNVLIAVISGAGGYVDSNTPPDGQVWHVTHLNARDDTSPLTAVLFATFMQAQWGILANEIRAIAALEEVPVKVDCWLEHDDFIRPSFIGALAGDVCRIILIGEVFTKEV